MRLSNKLNENQHHLKIPNHNPLKIGTLNNILKEISKRPSISKDELLKRLF
jgi:hypothetical protein